MLGFINTFIKGIFVGVANIIPGVSGGTIAVVLHIFDKMIDAINNFYKDFKSYASFLIPLFLGALFGIVMFSKLIKNSLEAYSFETSMFFVGLVIGSIPLIYKNAVKEKVNKNKKILSLLIGFISFIIVVAISFLTPDSANEVSGVPDFSIGLGIKMFLSAVIASSAMVIPGISGSFVMLLIGIYYVVLNSISGFTEIASKSIKMISSDGIGSALSNVISSNEFMILLFVGAGVVVGIVVISKIIDILFKKFYTFTYFGILGLIFASIVSIFKDDITYQSYPNGITITAIIIGVITCVIGFFISIILGKEK